MIENLNKIKHLFTASVIMIIFFSPAILALPLRGIVTDSLWNRQGGAIIELYEPKRGTLLYSIEADAAGYFEFQNITEMDYQIKVTTQTYPDQWFSYSGNTVYRQYHTRIDIATTPDTLYILAVPNPLDNPPDNTLTVFITDSAGRTLQNQSVYVALLRQEDYYEFPGQDNSSGASMTFDTLQAASYAILIRASGYPMQYYHPDRNTSQPKIWLAIGGGQVFTQTVRMVDPTAGDGAFHGSCRSETDQPLEGIVVALCQPSDTFRVIYMQTTGSDGKYSFVNIMEADYLLRFSGGGYPVQWYSMERGATTRNPEGTVWSMHAPHDTMLVRLSTSPIDNPMTGSVTVTVKDSAGIPMSPPGIVSLVDAGSTLLYSPGFDSLSGSFIAENIPAGNYFIKLSFPPYPVQYYSPVGNTSGPAYAFPLMVNDRLYFSPKLLTNPGQTSSNAIGFVNGFVRDSLGGVGNAMVTIYNSGFGIIQTAVTKDDGSFTTLKLPVQEIYIGVQAAGYPPQYWSPRGMTPARSMENSVYLIANDSITINADLEWFSGTTGSDTAYHPTVTTTVTGKAYDAGTGSPVSGVRIVFFDFVPENFNSRYLWSPWIAYTDSTGRFIINNIPLGSYRCMAEADSFNYVAQFYPKADMLSNAKVIDIDSTVKSLTLDFSLRKGGTIRGTVVDMSGAPLRDANIDVRSSDNSRWFHGTTGEDGSYTIVGVPRGTWNIWAGHDAYLMVEENQQREYTVTEGATLQVPVFRMEKGGHLSGTFTSQLSLSDTAFGTNFYWGNLSLYRDTLRKKDEQLWPEFSCGINFETTASTARSGTFHTGAIRTGAYRMVFTPPARSRENDATAVTTASLLPGLGYSFVGSGGSFGMLPVTVVNAGDTVGNLVLSLRKGYSVFGRLLGENNTPLIGSFGIDVLIKQDSLYLRVGYSAVQPDGRFELPGLIDSELYYFMLWAEGYPSQYWSAGGNTVSPSEPYRFDAATYSPLQLIIVRNPEGIDPWNVQGPISLWIEGDSLGFPLLVWNGDQSLAVDDFILYSSDRLGKVTPIATLPRSSSSSKYIFRDLRTGVNFREYLVVGKGHDLVIRSNRNGFDPRNSTAASTGGLWLNVYNSRWGIQLEWGTGKDLTVTEKDSVNVYRGIGAETPRLLLRRSAWETWINDDDWSGGDSGKTFTYYVELPGRQLVSPRVSKTLDASFFASLAKKLSVGPYEKYRRISDAVAAANDFDHIEVRPGTYAETISFAGKNLSINGSWDFGTPPVIDAGGGIAFTVPYCKNGGEWDRPRISGFAIRNGSIGIKSNAAVEVEECLFDNITAALSMSIDSNTMVQRIIANPFMPSSIEGNVRHCTFIAKKPGSLVATLTAIGSAEQAGYSGPYSGQGQFYITPTISLSSSVNVELSNIAFYQSSGLQTALPVTLQGNTPRVRFERCNVWKTSTELRSAGVELAGNCTALDPRFVDSTWWFIAAASPLAGMTWDSRIGYDARTLYGGKEGPYDEDRPSALRNVTAVTVGLNAVLVRWSASPAEENVVRYRIYRAPGDPSLFYINQASEWDLKIPEDSIFKVIDSFSTVTTAFLDTTVQLGTPYLYVVVAVNSEGNEGKVNLPAPPDIATYFVNKPVDRVMLAAGKWHMVGAQGASAHTLNDDTRHVLFGWDDNNTADKTLAHYTRTYRMQSTGGYWFKPAIDTVITVSASSLGALKSIESTAVVNLTKGGTGWNLISSPFPFAITPDWLGSFTAWEWNADSLGYRKAQSLRPWNAYWVYADGDTSLQLWKKQPLAYYQSGPLAKAATLPLLWQLRLTLQDEKSWDTDNFIGVVPASLHKTRLFATPEPPAAFDAVRLYFMDQDAAGFTEGGAERYAQLYKTVSHHGMNVEWIIGIGALKSASKLSVKDIADLPDDLFILWVEKDRIINLREQSTVEIAPHPDDVFGYIVVTADPGDLALYTRQLALMTPYPNPFKGSAVIQYTLPYAWTKNGALPGNGKLPLVISLYDITGKKVITLVDEPRGPGMYRTVWNGKNGSGRQAAAGMYVVKLKYGKAMKTARLYRVR
ncbi:MAG: carboxypeptidase regulatory-like domain-containing protein [Chitinispirillaceae bacterium]|nr:carboxypeptidase regulatory-like domain-containing protein [Chitinispirillaceae bacterium]